MVEKRGHPFRGLWISFEAGEGAGKDTQIERLVQYLSDQNYEVVYGREPGQTPFGEKWRALLQDPNMPPLHPEAETLGYVAAGIHFFRDIVVPVLERGGIFIANRWRDATKAYQGHGLGMSLEVIDMLTRFSCSDNYPDLTCLLDVPARIGLSHVSGNEFVGHTMDKIESRPIEYHERVNEGYRQIARENPDRFRVIPYIEGDIEGMQAEIRQHIEEYISQHNLRDKLLRKS